MPQIKVSTKIFANVDELGRRNTSTTKVNRSWVKFLNSVKMIHTNTMRESINAALSKYDATYYCSSKTKLIKFKDHEGMFAWILEWS